MHRESVELLKLLKLLSTARSGVGGCATAGDLRGTETLFFSFLIAASLGRCSSVIADVLGAYYWIMCLLL